MDCSGSSAIAAGRQEGILWLLLLTSCWVCICASSTAASVVALVAAGCCEFC
jgi:hypothetical protein